VALRGRRPRVQTVGMTVRRIRERERTRSSTRPPAWFNRFTVAVLRSPLHGLADADVCALTFQGRRSGRRITLPVLYAARGDALVVLVGDAADKQWWRNFRQPRAVEVVCHGRRSAATAHIMDRAEPGYDVAAATYRQRHHVAPGRGDRLLLVEPATA
jgi:hypothetical protein